MMNEQSDKLDILLLDKKFQIKCPPQSQKALLDAAKQLDQRMREVRDRGRVVGLERIAVMTALNIMFELLNQQNQEAGNAEATKQRLSNLNEQLDVALQETKQLELDTIAAE